MNGDHTVGGAFGLHVEADFLVMGLTSQLGADGLPVTRLHRKTAEEVESGWSTESSELLVDRRAPGGQKVMTVESQAESGYLIDTPDHGKFRISADGSTIDCATGPGPAWHWHRPLFAQALPIAAALNGREVLHASGVVTDGRGVAFVGHSGAGKTSLALHLAAQGAELLADDVVALSTADGRVEAHPGVRFANVAPEQLDSILADRRQGLGEIIGRSDKLHILIDGLAETPAPLTRLYFVDRGPATPALEFVRLDSPSPQWLLGATFLSHISSPLRQLAQLEVCSRIAAEVETYHLQVPPSLGARDLASAVAVHLEA
jgi:hypothetical protein